MALNGDLAVFRHQDRAELENIRFPDVRPGQHHCIVHHHSIRCTSRDVEDAKQALRHLHCHWIQCDGRVTHKHTWAEPDTSHAEHDH